MASVKSCMYNQLKGTKITKKNLSKAVDKCIKNNKINNYKPVRIKELEEPSRHLIRWYEDPKTGDIASFWDEPRNAHMRVSTQKGSDEIGFPFASLKRQPEDWFKRTAVKWWKKV